MSLRQDLSPIPIKAKNYSRFSRDYIVSQDVPSKWNLIAGDIFIWTHEDEEGHAVVESTEASENEKMTTIKFYELL